MPDIDTGTLYLWEWTQTIFVLLLMVLLISHISSFRLTLHRPPPPGGQCQMQSLSTQTSGGCTCGLPMSQVTKKGAKNKLWKKQVFWRNGTGNWVFQPCLQILHRILAPHLLHWPKVQSFVGFDTFHNTSNFENTIWARLAKISGSPRQTGSALVVTQRQRVLFVSRNWSHLKTNWRNVRIQMIWRRLELKIIYLLQQRSNDKT